MNQEKIKQPKGRVTIRVYDHSQGDKPELIREEVGDNLIVSQASEIMANILGGTLSKNINTFGVGTDATAPTSGDTGLTSAFTKAIGAITYPSAGTVRFSMQLTTAEANGTTISEWGLFTDDGTLFSRRTPTPIAKTASISVLADWDISF